MTRADAMQEDNSHDEPGGSSRAQLHTTGVHSSPANRVGYDLTVVATDVVDVVQYAGGWMCDRVRAGWRVNVLVPNGSDARPVRILGATALDLDIHLKSLASLAPAAVAVGAHAFTERDQVRIAVTSATQGNTELTFWGDSGPLDLARRVEPVQYRLSACARAFKFQALLAARAGGDPPESMENFRSCALWYPSGPDLSPAGWPSFG